MHDARLDLRLRIHGLNGFWEAAPSVGDSNEDVMQTAVLQFVADLQPELGPAGAGIGIDSGLPDFCGENGFWNAYPALGMLGMNFSEIANPKAFVEQPELVWGFYGHRLRLYRDTVPHEGFRRLPCACQEHAKRCADLH